MAWKIHQGRCKKGTPFCTVEDRSARKVMCNKRGSVSRFYGASGKEMAQAALDRMLGKPASRDDFSVIEDL